VLKAEELVARVAWTRFCGSLGAAIAIGGVWMLIVTGITMGIHMGDTAATISVGLALLAVVVLMAFWTLAFVNRFGLYGIVADRPRSRAVPDATIASPKLEPTATANVPSVVAPTVTAKPEPVIPPTAEKTKRSAAKRTFQPWSTPVEPDFIPEEPITPGPAVATVDASRSEVINPSDAAALDRILSEPDTSSVSEEINVQAENDDATGDSTEVIDPPGAAAVEGAESNDSPEMPLLNPVRAAPWNTRKHQRR